MRRQATGTDWVAACVSNRKVRIGALKSPIPSELCVVCSNMQQQEKKSTSERRICAADGAESQMRSGLEADGTRRIRSYIARPNCKLQNRRHSPCSCSCPCCPCCCCCCCCSCPALPLFPCRCTSHNAQQTEPPARGVHVRCLRFRWPCRLSPVGGLDADSRQVPSLVWSRLTSSAAVRARCLGPSKTRFGKT